MNFNNINDIDYFTNFSNSNSGSNNNLFSPYEGYLKGNLFQNLYDGYKNYKPYNIPVKNERDELLLNVGQLSFAAHELNLLLDKLGANVAFFWRNKLPLLIDFCELCFLKEESSDINVLFLSKLSKIVPKSKIFGSSSLHLINQLFS